MAQAMTLIGSVTLSSTQSGVVFSNLPQTFKYLYLSVVQAGSTGQGFYVQFNNDTSTSNYGANRVYGNGISAGSAPDQLIAYESTNILSQAVINIMDYAATDKHKVAVSRWGSTTDTANFVVNRWLNTSAITSVHLNRVTGNFNIGSTFYLYGIIG